jgi:hypothetical protein
MKTEGGQKYYQSNQNDKLSCRQVSFAVLKVDGNEKQWGPGRRQMLGNGLGPWQSMFIFNLNMQFLSKNVLFHFPLVTSN